MGGRGSVSMSALQKVFEGAGFEDVRTYINSGNVIFEYQEKDTDKLCLMIEELLARAFFKIKTILLTDSELKEVLKHTPSNWNDENLRKYIAFIKSPSTPDKVIDEALPKESVDMISKGPGVVYMSTKLSGISQSGFPKLSVKKVYQDMTVRNYNTVKKLLDLV